MLIFNHNTERIRKNARFIICGLGAGKPGENVLFICDSDCRDNAFILSDVALESGLHPLVIDIDSFGREEKRYMGMPVLKRCRRPSCPAICFHAN